MHFPLFPLLILALVLPRKLVEARLLSQLLMPFLLPRWLPHCLLHQPLQTSYSDSQTSTASAFQPAAHLPALDLDLALQPQHSRRHSRPRLSPSLPASSFEFHSSNMPTRHSSTVSSWAQPHQQHSSRQKMAAARRRSSCAIRGALGAGRGSWDGALVVWESRGWLEFA